MGDILLTNASIIDGLGNDVEPDMVIHIRDSRIYRIMAARDWIDSVESRDVRDECTVIDCTEMTVMPGLIDAHCHMTYGESFGQEEQDIFTSVEGRTLRSAWNVQKVLASGVTGISQPGGSYFIGVAVRDAIEEGRISGPRMTSAGRYISTSNGLTDFYPDNVGPVEGGIGIRCNTLDDMITEVRRQVKNGVDFIKLADSPMGEYQSFRNEELQVIADLAHQLGRKITIHARGDAEMRAAVEAGFDWVMHGNVMTQQTVDLIAARETPLVPTLVLLENWVEHAKVFGESTAIGEACKRMLDRTEVSLNMAREAGVKFVTGTDTGFAITPYGEWHAKELELLMKYAGLTASEAIQSATSNAAITLNLPGEVGQITEGALADVLVVDGNPLADIRILQDPNNLKKIIANGEIVAINPELKSWPNLRSRHQWSNFLTRQAVSDFYRGQGN